MAASADCDDRCPVARARRNPFSLYAPLVALLLIPLLAGALKLLGVGGGASADPVRPALRTVPVTSDVPGVATTVGRCDADSLHGLWTEGFSYLDLNGVPLERYFADPPGSPECAARAEPTRRP